MGYYWGGEWHDEPEPVERIAERAAARARETGRTVTISTGRVRVSASPSGRVRVRQEGGGGSGSVSPKPKAKPADQQPQVSEKPKEATVSREELEELTGRRYAGLKEKIPKWQAEAILRQEGFTVQEVTTETGERKLVAVKTVSERPAKQEQAKPQTPLEKLTQKMTEAVKAQNRTPEQIFKLAGEHNRQQLTKITDPGLRREAERNLREGTVTLRGGKRLQIKEGQEVIEPEPPSQTEVAIAKELMLVTATGFGLGAGLTAAARIAPRAAMWAGRGLTAGATALYGKEAYGAVKEGDLTRVGILTGEFVAGGVAAYGGAKAASRLLLRGSALDITPRQPQKELAIVRRLEELKVNIFRQQKGEQVIETYQFIPRYKTTIEEYTGQKPAKSIPMIVEEGRNIFIGEGKLPSEAPIMLIRRGIVDVPIRGGKPEFVVPDVVKSPRGAPREPGVTEIGRIQYRVLKVETAAEEPFTPEVTKTGEVIRTPEAKRALRHKLYGKTEAEKNLERLTGLEERGKGGGGRASTLEQQLMMEENIVEVRRLGHGGGGRVATELTQEVSIPGFAYGDIDAEIPTLGEDVDIDVKQDRGRVGKNAPGERVGVFDIGIEDDILGGDMGDDLLTDLDVGLTPGRTPGKVPAQETTTELNVDVTVPPEIPPGMPGGVEVFEEPGTRPPRISLDVDVVDIEGGGRHKGYNPYTFLNPWAEAEDMLSILFGGGGSGGGGNRRRKRRRRK